MSKYGEVGFWDKRYSTKDPITLKIQKTYDWYVDAEDAKNLVQSYLAGNLGAKILIVGCGNSNVTRLLYNAGYKNIVCIDFSQVLVDLLLERDRDLEGVQVLTMDSRNLTMFPDDTFHCILDKACLDSVMSGNTSVDAAHDMLEEVSRVLRVDGLYLSFTYANQEARFPHLKKPQFRWVVGQTSMSTGIDNDVSYNVFVCTKKSHEDWAKMMEEEEMLKKKKEDEENKDSEQEGQFTLEKTRRKTEVKKRG
jgi:EEF1A lysine methyltransferase 4